MLVYWLTRWRCNTNLDLAQLFEIVENSSGAFIKTNNSPTIMFITHFLNAFAISRYQYCLREWLQSKTFQRPNILNTQQLRCIVWGGRTRRAHTHTHPWRKTYKKQTLPPGHNGLWPTTIRSAHRVVKTSHSKPSARALATLLVGSFAGMRDACVCACLFIACSDKTRARSRAD